MNGAPQNETPRTSREGVKNLARVLLIALLLSVILKSCVVEAYRIPTSSMETTLLPGDFIVVNKLAYFLSTPDFIPFIETPLHSKKLISWSAPKRNDIVTFVFPGEQNQLAPQGVQYYIKRVIGLPGETLRIMNRRVFINNTEVSPPLPLRFSREAKLPGAENDKIFPEGAPWNEDYYGPFRVPAKGMTVRIDSLSFAHYHVLIGRENPGKVFECSRGQYFLGGTKITSYTFRKNYFFMLGDNRPDSYDSRFIGPVPEENISGKALFIYLSLDPFAQSFPQNVRFTRMFRGVR